MSIFLGVNIDHIATLRQARGTKYPSLIDAALICENSGADSITLHLREDRRHIQDNDVIELKSRLKTKMNLEMAATDEMLKIASHVLPEDCCLVPEKRQELTTEGGLDVASQINRMKEARLPVEAPPMVSAWSCMLFRDISWVSSPTFGPLVGMSAPAGATRS